MTNGDHKSIQHDSALCQLQESRARGTKGSGTIPQRGGIIATLGCVGDALGDTE